MRNVLIFLVLVFFCVGTYFIFNRDQGVDYLTQEVQKSDIFQTIESIGKVDARHKVDVGAQVSGQIIKLYVDLGSRVKEGDLIAQIDKDKQQNHLDITRAQLQSARAKLESKKIAFEIATKQYQREQRLYAAKASSLENLEAQKNNFYSLKASLAQLNAQVIESEINLKNAQKDLDYTTIRAPIDGIVINVAVNEGQAVSASQNIPTIVRIANLDEMEIKMEIAEADVDKIDIGTKLEFSLLSNPRRTYQASIANIDPADTKTSDKGINTSSSTSNSAIYYYAKFYVKNENNFLRIGMSVQNQIIIASAKNVIVVPTYTIKHDPKGYYVEVLENKRAVKKYVQLGIKDAINTEILKGLHEGEWLILSANK